MSQFYRRPPSPGFDLTRPVLLLDLFVTACFEKINEWNVWVSMCVCFVHEWKCKEKGKECFHFALSNPLSFFVSAPFSLFLIPPFSCCQSTLSFCQFVFNLRLIFSFFKKILPSFSSLSALFCSHLSILFSIHCLIFIVWLSNNLQYVILWWLVKTGNYSHSTHNQFPNTHSSHVA